MGKGKERFTPTIMGEKKKSNGPFFYETVSVPDFFFFFARNDGTFLQGSFPQHLASFGTR